MVAVVYNGNVISVGNYTVEDFFEGVIIVPITQEQKEFIESCTYPKYDGVNFHDISEEEKQLLKYEENCQNERVRTVDRIPQGQYIWSLFFSRLRIQVLMGTITEAERRLKLQVFDNVRSALFNGDFEESKTVLESIGIQVIGQQLYDEFHTYITDFIGYNYDDYGLINVNVLRKK